MHGTEHRLDEILDDHPNGRCAMIPKTRTWAEIGKQYGIDLSDVPDTNPEIEPGFSLFERLPAEKQIKILGPAKYAAWKDGKFALSDIVGRARSKEWGTHRYEKSLTELGIDARKYLIAPKKNVFGKTREEVEKIAKEIDARMQEIVGGKQKWSGKIFIKSRGSLPDAWGAKEWNCNIWLRDDSDIHTLIHELLHGRSNGLTEKLYQQYRMLEEGTVEGLARTIGGMVYPEYSGHHGSYQEFVDALENIRSRTEFSELDFYLMLLKTDLSQRASVLLDLFREKDYYEVANILSFWIGK